jgi:hypothetical protein
MESIHLIIPGNIDAAPSRDTSGAVVMGAGHLFVRATAAVHNCAGLSVITVQPLVARVAASLGANHPYNHVIIPIRRGDKRRAATVSAHAPPVGDGRRASSSDAKDRKRAAVGPQSKIAVFVSSIGCWCLSERDVGNLA